MLILLQILVYRSLVFHIAHHPVGVDAAFCHIHHRRRRRHHRPPTPAPVAISSLSDFDNMLKGLRLADASAGIF